MTNRTNRTKLEKPVFKGKAFFTNNRSQKKKKKFALNTFLKYVNDDTDCAI
jgi:hypothetical protein